MSDMIERAAESLWLWSEMRREPIEKYRISWADAPEDRKSYLRLEARAALLAALDPEDEALVRFVAGGMGDRAEDWIDEARAAIETLKRAAQGEQS